MDSSGLMVKSKLVHWMWHTYTPYFLLLFVKDNKMQIKCGEKILEVCSSVLIKKPLFPCQSHFNCTIIINNKVLRCAWGLVHSTKLEYQPWKWICSLNPKRRLKVIWQSFGLLKLFDMTFKVLLDYVKHLTFFNKCHNILAIGYKEKSQFWSP
jgi:hypothetical protein